MDLLVKPSILKPSQIQLPGDKSITHRALIIGSLGTGTTQLEGILESQDCLATLKAMQQLGVKLAQPAPGKVVIQGRGLDHLSPPTAPIDCGNSGTSMRLLAGLLSAQPFNSALYGDASLSRRPMERITLPLSTMGANIKGQLSQTRETPPLEIKGGPLQGITYVLPVESAQIKSCLLLAGLYAKGPTVIVEKGLCRDHTERMLKSFGCDIVTEQNKIVLTPGKTLFGQTLHIPGDFSSAAFFIGAASMNPGAEMVLSDIGVNDRRIGMLKILRRMGANIKLINERQQSGEAVADIEVKGSTLKGIEVPQEWVVSAMDEFPMLFIIAACAQGKTVIRGVKELRVKETDRIKVMCEGLKILGAHVEEFPDGVIISGGSLQGGELHSYGDHRVAMAFAMAATKTNTPIKIKDCDNIATSFPNFSQLAAQVGLDIQQL